MQLTKKHLLLAFILIASTSLVLTRPSGPTKIIFRLANGCDKEYASQAAADADREYRMKIMNAFKGKKLTKEECEALGNQKGVTEKEKNKDIQEKIEKEEQKEKTEGPFHKAERLDCDKLESCKRVRQELIDCISMDAFALVIRFTPGSTPTDFDVLEAYSKFYNIANTISRTSLEKELEEKKAKVGLGECEESALIFVHALRKALDKPITTADREDPITKKIKATPIKKLYRGSNFVPRVILTLGGVYRFNAFVSTTSSKKVAIKFAINPTQTVNSLIFVIRVSHDIRGVDIMALSNFPHEEEVLLNRFSFKVTKIYQPQDPRDEDPEFAGIKTVYVDVVPSEEGEIIYGKKKRNQLK